VHETSTSVTTPTIVWGTRGGGLVDSRLHEKSISESIFYIKVVSVFTQTRFVCKED